MIYLDSSVALAYLLAEDRYPANLTESECRGLRPEESYI